MKTLIIPDVHERHEAVRSILSKFGHIERKVWLGDFLDSWNGTPEDTAETCLIIKELLKDPNNILLLGNHEASYRWAGNFRCSGFTLKKYKVVHSMITEEEWDKFKVYTRVGPYLVSHAGFHPGLADPILGLCDEYLDHEYRASLDWAMKGKVHPFFGAGKCRGGRQRVSGPLWLDWNYEFVPIIGVPQIVGHTEISKPEIKHESWNLDSRMHHVAVVDGPNLEVVEV